MSLAPTLWRASVRHSLRHPWQFGLSLLGIALGVAVVVAIDLSIESARRAFTLSNEAVLGSATHRLRGGPSGIDEALYARLRGALGDVPMAPVVEGWVATPPPRGATLRLLGVDPFAEAPFRAHLGAVAGDGDQGLAALLARPRTVLASARTAARLGVRPGETLAVVVNGRETALELVGRIAARDALARESLSDLLVADIATAQEVLGRTGRLDYVDLLVSPGQAGERELERLRALLPGGVRVEAAGTRAGAAERMTRAFDLNLLMLSLLAVLVGMFLVYNTMTFSVVQRRELFGMLRAMGVARAEIFRMVLTEASAVAGAAAVAGVVLGLALSGWLVDLVTRTINDHYFAVSVRGVSVSPWVIAKALALGLGAALAAALLPAWEATHVEPRAALARSTVESSVRRRVPAVTLAGVAAEVLALFLVWLPGAGLGAGFAALFAMVVGFALLAPAASLLLLRILQPLAVLVAGWLGRLAVRGVAAHFSRTAVAVAALMVALSATVGVGVMVDSFRRSVAQWLDVTLRADFYVGLPGAPGERALDPGLAARIARLPGVADMSTGRGVTVEASTGPVELVALEMAERSYAGFMLVEGGGREAWEAFDDREAVLVSEPYSRRHDVHPGDAVEVFTDRGPRRFPVAAVFRDYGSEHGVLIVSRATYDRYWDDDAVSTLGVYAAPGVDVEALANAVRESARSEQQVVVQSNRLIKEASMNVFDRTFKVTAVLRMLATIIAFVGVLSALMALALERAKEVAVLRAQGLTPREVWTLVQTQTAATGVIAGLLCLPVGIAMALVLILVINRRSFGWTMPVHVDPAILLEALVLAVAAALVAGIYPAYRMARISPADALREE